MKKIVFVVATLLLIWVSCEKDPYLIKEEDAIENYIETNLISDPPTSSGLYYVLEEVFLPVSTDSLPPFYGDTIVFNFVGKMLTQSSKVYYQEDSMRFVYGVDESIPGLNEGLGFVREGSKATLVLPSDLAYGDVQVGDVPPYTPLLIELTVHEIIRPYEKEEEAVDEGEMN